MHEPERDRVDLARNAPGIGITHEAARRRQTEGAGADRSWRIGADGEFEVAHILATLTEPTGLARILRRRPAWRVLHSVPLGNDKSEIRGDVDHLVIGPPGVVTINTKHHRAGRLALDGDALVVNGRRTDYIAKARREADRVRGHLLPALAAAGHPDLAAHLAVRPVICVVGGRVVIRDWPAGVSVLMTRQLVPTLTSMATALTLDDVDTVWELARYSTTWTSIR